MILVFSLESHINATGENGPFTSISEPGVIGSDVAIDKKRCIYNVTVDRRELVLWCTYAIQFLRLEANIHSNFCHAFWLKTFANKPGFLVLLSTKPRWPGGFGLPRHAHLAAVGQCGLRLRSGCAERAILAPKIPGSTGWHGGLLRPGRKGIWGVFSPKLFFPVCFFVNANTAGVLKHRKWWGNHGQFEIIVVCWNG